MTKTFDIHLQRTAGDRAMAVGLHPGTVKTELSREFWGSAERGRGLRGVEEAVEDIWEVVGRLGVEARGGFGIEGGWRWGLE